MKHILSLLCLSVGLYGQTYDELYDMSIATLKKQQEELKTKYKLGTYKMWWYDQDKCVLQFMNDQEILLEFKVAAAGDFSKKTNTWLWSWDNKTISPDMSRPILKVKDFGIKNSYTRLYTPKIDGDMTDAWEFAAISNSIVGGMGVYCANDSNTECPLMLIILSVDIFKTGG